MELMLSLTKIKKEDRLIRAFTGLNLELFTSLSKSLEEELALAAQEDTTKRKRRKGGGRKHTLKTAEDKSLFILFYFKCYPTMDLAGVFFNADRSNVCHWIEEIQPVVEKVLDKKLCLPERKINSIESFITMFPEVKEVIIDGVERPVQRPKDKEKQEAHYSGKKKRHTKKQLVVSTTSKEILVITPARQGRIHDKKLLDEEGLVEHIPDQVEIKVDLGFKGLEKEYVNIEIPERKKRKQQLSADAKEQNKRKSSKRVSVEHAIGGMKRYKVASDIYRNKRKNLDDDFMATAAGLWNYYINFI